MPFYQAELDIVSGILRQFNLKVTISTFDRESLLRLETGPRRIIAADTGNKLSEIFKRGTKKLTRSNTSTLIFI